MTFRGLGSEAALLPIQDGFAVEKLADIEGYAVAGRMHLIPPYPGNGSSAVVPTDIDSSATDNLVITFPTGEAVVPASERRKVERFVSDWTKRLGGP
jgi:hypothetical protein